MLDEQVIASIANEMQENHLEPHENRINHPTIELSEATKQQVNQLLEKFKFFYNRRLNNSYFNKLPLELNNIILHQAFGNLVNCIKDTCYPFFKQALLQQDDTFAQLLLASLGYHSEKEMEKVLVELFKDSHRDDSERFLNRILTILSRHPELRYQVLSRVMEMKFIRDWVSTVSKRISVIDNTNALSKESLFLMDKLLTGDFLELDNNFTSNNKIIYEINFIDPKAQLFVNVILDVPDLFKKFLSQNYSRNFFYEVIRKNDMNMFFQFLSSSVKHPEIFEKLLNTTYNGSYLLQEVMDRLTEHQELRNIIISQVVDKKFLIQWLRETDIARQQKFMIYLAQNPILFRRFICNLFETFPFMDGLKELSEELLSEFSVIFQEQTYSPTNHSDEQDKSTGYITDAESLTYYSGQFRLFTCLSRCPKLLHKILIIQDPDSGRTIFHHIIESEDLIASKEFKLVLDTLGQKMLLEQFMVRCALGISGVEYAILSKNKSIIELMCDYLSNNQELLEQVISYLNSDEQQCSTVDKKLWIKNIKSLQEIFYKIPESFMINLSARIFLVKDDSGKTLFSRLSKQLINIEAVEEFIKSNYANPLVFEKRYNEVFFQFLVENPDMQQIHNIQCVEDSSNIPEQPLTSAAGLAEQISATAPSQQLTSPRQDLNADTNWNRLKAALCDTYITRSE